MFLLQATLGISSVLVLGTLGMFIMAITLVLVVVFHQRKVIRFNKQIQKMEEERLEKETQKVAKCKSNCGVQG